MATKQHIHALKDVLIIRKEELIEHIKNCRKNIDQLKAQECKDDLDYAELSSDSYTEGLIINQQITILKEIDDALDRIDTDTYGICAMCDERIAIGRLRAKPFAKYCTPCREIFEQK